VRKSSTIAASPRVQLAGFIKKYSPRIAADGRACLATMRKRMPRAHQFVYDNFNWLVIGFGPTARPSDAVFSLVFNPRWITLCFLQDGPDIPDPHKLLKGSGTVVRSMRLTTPEDLESPGVRALMRDAMTMSWKPMPRGERGTMVVRAVAKRQRSRRP